MLIKNALGLVAVSFLVSGCGSTGSSASTPSLSSPTPPTSRLPSPGNVNRTNLMESSTMTAPSRP